MSLNSSGLDAFYVCAQVKNFTRAAEQLFITQSALSQRIKNLEEEIGATLLVRDRSGVRLTEPGEKLLRYCQTRSQLEQNIVSELGGATHSIQGILRVAGFSSVLRSLIIPTCRKLFAEAPHIQIETMGGELSELPTLLRNSSTDFILLDQSLEREGIKSQLLGHELNVRLRKKATNFSGYFLDHDSEDETTQKFLKLKSGSKLKRHFLDDIYGIIDGVRAGLGDAIVPKHLIESWKDFEIVDEDRILKTPVYLHYYEQPILPKISQRFLEIIQQESNRIFLRS